jgi:hypothetical protein
MSARITAHLVHRMSLPGPAPFPSDTYLGESQLNDSNPPWQTTKSGDKRPNKSNQRRDGLMMDEKVDATPNG